MNKNDNSPSVIPLEKYQDELHSETDDGLVTGEHGYKYRLLEGIMFPPYVTPGRYALSRNMQTRAGDVCYCSYPKSGSTWLANVLYLILNNGEVPEDRTLRGSLHWMESSWPYPRSLEEVDALPSPRIFKSHMPHAMALAGGPEKGACKYIYIARNPKDVCVSYYHFESGKSWSGGYSGPWDHWFNQYTRGLVQRGSWFDHVLSWWQHKDHPNLLFLKYEDMKRDFDGELAKIMEFLGVGQNAGLLARIKTATSFETMKKEKFSSHPEIEELKHFFRKGEIGSWKDQFTVAQSELFDRLYAERMAGTGLSFDFE